MDSFFYVGVNACCCIGAAFIVDLLRSRAIPKPVVAVAVAINLTI
jgi:hypothetical protein